MTGELHLSAKADILAIIVARIGDTLLVTPALRALKAAAPHGSLTVMAHPKRLALLDHLAFVDHLGPITKHSAFWKGRLPKPPVHDLAVVWGHDKSLVSFALRSAQTVVAFSSNEPPVDGLISVAPPPTPMHAVEERLLLLDAIRIPHTDHRLSYVATNDEISEAREWLSGQGASPLLIGIQPRSFATKAHRDWPVSSIVELLRKLAERYPIARFVVLGDRFAKDSAAEIRAALGDVVIVAAGLFALRASAAILACLDLYIGVDTGPTHIAGALGIPMVALYHCSYPGRNLAPLDHPALRVIEHPATWTAEAGTARSMAEIPVSPVLTAASELLAERGWR